MRSEGYSTWSVCLCVCLCVCYSTSHFSRDYLHLKRYQPPQRRMKVEKVKRFSLKMLRCEARVFPVGTATYDKSAIFYSAENVLAYESRDHVASGHFVLGRDVVCEFDYWPLAVSMPPTKVCPQCKAAVPV